MIHTKEFYEENVAKLPNLEEMFYEMAIYSLTIIQHATKI
jgi:hypothetical protein